MDTIQLFIHLTVAPVVVLENIFSFSRKSKTPRTVSILFILSADLCCALN